MEKVAPRVSELRAPEGRVAVPLEVQLEIAKQNQKLAEIRYRTSVQRGRAWDMPTREEIATEK